MASKRPKYEAEKLGVGCVGYGFLVVFHFILHWLKVFSSTPTKRAGNCMCECGREEWVGEDSPAKRKTTNSAAWRSCQDTVAKAPTAEAAPRPSGGGSGCCEPK